MRAKRLIVSEIGGALQKSKPGIHHVLARVEDFKRISRSGMVKVTTYCKKNLIKNIVTTGNYSFSHIKHIVEKEISKKSFLRRVLESR